MKTFNNLREIEKWIGTQQGQKSVLNEDNIRKILMDAGRELEGYMKDELNAYFNSYEPKVYKRSGDTLNSIMVGEPHKISINEWALEITFDPKLANHPSVIGDDQPDGYTPITLELGWDIRDKVPYDRPMFTHHPGTQFMKKAVETFNRNNKHDLKVTIDINGNKYV